MPRTPKAAASVAVSDLTGTLTNPVPAPDVDRLRDENAALRAQNDQVLDAIVEMREEMDRLKTAQGVVADAVIDNAEERALDAEHTALMKEFERYPAINVFERRALVGVDANLAIRLHEDPSPTDDPHAERCYWKLRWFNFATEGRAQRATAEGYIKVNWDELQDQESVSLGDRTRPYVCKGERGLEVLHKIPGKLYDYKKRRDSARLNGVLTSESKLREHVTSGVERRVGKDGGNADQAGSFAHTGLSMSITRGETERVTPA